MQNIINKDILISVNLEGSNLTATEMEIIRSLLAGYSVADISRRRCRTVKTVSTQKLSAYRKLGIRNDVSLFPVLIKNWKMEINKSF
jgi:Response regulator containing a CheY-like receiver domain and an HTH DNA-binding domain